MIARQTTALTSDEDNVSMFGSKLKIWMENHIGRPRRKSQQEKEKSTGGGGGGGGGRGGQFLESSESLAQSDTGVSSGSQQVLSSSNGDNNESYCTAMESDRGGLAHCHTAVNLSSPESAYSTGYSTDGASPGGTGPPEYYINIRTGKHYFPSPAPTPTSPQPSTAFAQLHPTNQCIATSFLGSDVRVPSIPTFPSQFSVTSSLLSTQLHSDLTTPSSVTSRLPTSSSQFSTSSNCLSPVLSPFVPESKVKNVKIGIEDKRCTLSTSVPTAAVAPNHFEIFNFSKSPSKKLPPKSPLSSFKLFLKSPKAKPDVYKTPTPDKKKKSVSPSKNNKKWYKQPFHKFGHRRMDSTDETVKIQVKKDSLLDKNVYFLPKETTASPRQRNRIRTNPWLPTEPMSSQNFHSLQINFSPELNRNRSCTNTPLQNRKTNDPETFQTKIKQMNIKYEDSKEYLNTLEKVVSRHIGQKLFLDLSDHSEEDLTLNEMMGTYNESYVYEKETDILSDSDPTDCEDYGTDSEADNGGDEQDSHDDELDFIDTGSVIDSEDNFKNTGKCTYHDVYVKKNSFLYKNSRKSFRKEQDSKKRRSKEEKKKRSIRKSIRCLEQKEDHKKIEVKDGNDGKNSKVELNENVGGLNLSRVLMQRMMSRNGSKSAEGTPVCVRRRKLMRELRETHIGVEKPELTPQKTNALIDAVLEKNFFLVDIEADKKYNELILEAENMLVSMKNSPIVRHRNNLDLLAEFDNDSNMESVNIWKTTETLCSPKHVDKFLRDPNLPARKSPRNLGLKLSVDEAPKRLKGLDFGKDKKSSFKAKSSAHSPLDPLGPTFKNFTIFKETPKKISSSSSDDSEPNKTRNLKKEEVIVPESPIVPIAFQSVDLGKPIPSYCPQSEPVKRKIYSCSKTYDKLVKRFENEPKIFHDSSGGNTRARHSSFMHKKHVDPEAPRPNSFRPPPKIPGVVPPKPPPPTGKFFYNPVYSPYGSPNAPRRSSVPSNVPSPHFQRRFDFDEFR